jgi:uncharacterized protein YdhG (YjbR/CyaY superfamily)
MKKRDVTLTDYLDSLDSEARPVFEELRQIALRRMESPKETMDYGFPAFRGNGVFGFSARKNYVSLYFHHQRNREVVEKHKDQLGKHEFSGETLRFPDAAAIPIPVIAEMVAELFG